MEALTPKYTIRASYDHRVPRVWEFLRNLRHVSHSVSSDSRDRYLCFKKSCKRLCAPLMREKHYHAVVFFQTSMCTWISEIIKIRSQKLTCLGHRSRLEKKRAVKSLRTFSELEKQERNDIKGKEEEKDKEQTSHCSHIRVDNEASKDIAQQQLLKCSEENQKTRFAMFRFKKRKAVLEKRYIRSAFLIGIPTAEYYNSLSWNTGCLCLYMCKTF